MCFSMIVDVEIRRSRSVSAWILQALASCRGRRPRPGPTRIMRREDVLGVLGVEARFLGEVLEGEVGRARAVVDRCRRGPSKPRSSRFPRTSSAKRRSVVGEVAHLELPAQVLDERLLLGEVLLDGRQLLEATAARGQRLLQRCGSPGTAPSRSRLVRLLVGLASTRSPRRGSARRGARRSESETSIVWARSGASSPSERREVWCSPSSPRTGLASSSLRISSMSSRRESCSSLDGLLQLWGHHELLAHLELLFDFHAHQVPPVAASRESGRRPTARAAALRRMSSSEAEASTVVVHWARVLLFAMKVCTISGPVQGKRPACIFRNGSQRWPATSRTESPQLRTPLRKAELRLR
jgi:hypothetical protein